MLNRPLLNNFTINVLSCTTAYVWFAFAPAKLFSMHSHGPGVPARLGKGQGAK